MKKKIILLLTTIGAAMAVGSFNGMKELKADGASWECINGERSIVESNGVVTLTTDVLNVQHQKKDLVYLDGCSFRFENIGSNNAMFFFTAESQTSVSFSGPVFNINRTGYGQTRVFAYANHDFNTHTNFLYSSMNPEVAGVGGQASPQIVCNIGTNSDAYDFAFERVDTVWWKVTITETVTGMIWEDTSNYNNGSVTAYVKNSDMTLNADGSGYMQIRGNSNGTTVFSNFVNGTAWEAPAGPDKAGGAAAVDAYVASKNKFEYTSDAWSSIQSAVVAAKEAIDLAEDQLDVDGAVAAFKSTVDGVTTRTWENDQDWTCTWGAYDARLPKVSEGTVKLVTDAYSVTYTKNEKVTLDGFQMTFGSYQTGADGNCVGFFFSDSATPTTSGNTGYQGACISVYPNRWGNQDRIGVTNSHDENGTVKAYQDYDGQQVAGFGGQGGNQLVLNAADPFLMTFKFEHVKKAWWKLTISETEYGKIELATTNYGTLDDNVTKYSSVFIKAADLPLDEDGKAYLNVYGLAGNAIVKDIVNGTYRDLPEEPATAEEIGNIKAKVAAATANYRDGFAQIAADLKNTALDLIDSKTYLSEMEPIVDQLKVDVKAAYVTYLGYNDAPTAVGADANWYDCWGQGTKAARLEDGEVLLALPNEFGVRGQLLRKIDPLNFTAKINLSNLIDSTALMINFDTADGSYCSEATKYYHIEFMMAGNGQVQVVLGNTAAHNVSVEGWSTTNVNTYTGKTIALTNSGDVAISVATNPDTNKTTVTINEATAELDTSVLFRGSNAPETPAQAAVQMGTLNNNGTTSLVRVDEFTDASYTTYKAGLADSVESAKTAFAADVTALNSAYVTTTSNPDADYANYLVAKETANGHINGTGLMTYDFNHFLAGDADAVRNAMTAIEADYAAKVATEKAKVTDLLASYDLSDYREAEQATLTTAKGEIEADLANVASCGAAQELFASAKATLDAIKTNATLVAEQALAEVKLSACSEVDSKLDLADDDHILELASMIATAKQAINACESIEEVNGELTSQLRTIDAAIAQWNNEIAAQALRAAKDSAIAEIVELGETADEKHASLVDAAVAAARTQIEGCTTVEEVQAKLAAGKLAVQEALNKVIEDKVEPHAKGCGGSLVAASSLVSALAFAGVLLLKRKEK